MAMVKADGYGHGMVMAARAFQRGGCTVFGVAELREGILLRQASIPGEIYVTIGFPGEEAGLILQYDLTPVIYNIDAARALSLQGVASGRDIGVHIKVDTGMSRLGVLPKELPAFAEQVSRLKNLRIAGIMSHFPESDDLKAESTKKNFAAFTKECKGVGGRDKLLLHIANSGAVLNFPGTCCDMVRAGISLYGYHPAGPKGCLTGDSGQLKPAMSFRSKVLQVKSVPEGTGISYGRTFVTQRKTRLAVLPVGYEDGYSRSLSNRGQVLIHGCRVPVLGRICMNMCMVDVSELSEVKAGDEAVLLGRQGEETISADEIAEKMGTISYEVLCLLGNNNKRQYSE